MAEYMFAYHGNMKPETPEQGQQMMADWQKWIADLGDVMINPGKPVGKSKTVSASQVEDHGGSNPLLGYSLVEADSIEAAVKIAQASPHCKHGGTIEVAETMQM